MPLRTRELNRIATKISIQELITDLIVILKYMPSQNTHGHRLQLLALGIADVRSKMAISHIYRHDSSQEARLECVYETTRTAKGWAPISEFPTKMGNNTNRENVGMGRKQLLVWLRWFWTCVGDERRLFEHRDNQKLLKPCASSKYKTFSRIHKRLSFSCI